jgi:hypothetical protein
MAIPKRKIDGEYVDISESGNWNVAIDYTKLKIMKWLYMADDYEVMAIFGTSEVVEEFLPNWNDKLKNELRIKGMYRYIDALMRVITNSKFAIRKKEDQQLLIGYYNDLEKYRDIVKYTFRKTTNQSTKKANIEIFEDRFENVINKIIQIKMDLNEPLNRSDLIFSFQDILDPSEMKKKLIDKLSTEA